MKVKWIEDKLLVGRDEWCALPEFGIPAIKAKIDTGAKTSSLHAFNIETYTKRQQKYVMFDIHPLQANNTCSRRVKAKVIDERYVMSSNGHKELRYVISTMLNIDVNSWEIELTLSNRDPLRYRLLLGREALDHRVLINTALSCNQGHISSKRMKILYEQSI